MARILIGNIKGPAGKIVSVSATKGEPGTDPQVTNVGTESDAKLQFVIPEGQKGEQGLQGPTGPMPPLVNNLTTNQAGQGALDAAQGKALADKDTALQSAVDALNRKTEFSIESFQIAGITAPFFYGVKIGNLVIAAVRLQGIGVITKESRVFKIPSSVTPSRQYIYFPMTAISSDSDAKYIGKYAFVDSSGYVSIPGLVGFQQCFFLMVYTV